MSRRLLSVQCGSSNSFILYRQSLPRAASSSVSNKDDEDENEADFQIDAETLVSLLGEQDDTLVLTMLRLLQIERSVRDEIGAEREGADNALKRLLEIPLVYAVSEGMSHEAVFEVSFPPSNTC